MKKIQTMAIACGIFTCTFLAFGIVARAADLGGMKDRTVYDSPAPVSGWTGGYIGGQLGYGWNSHDINVTVDDEKAIARSIDTDNLIGGVTAGFDYQAGSVVVGLFGQYNLGDSDTHNNEFDVTVIDGNSWMIGARAGVLVTPRTLVYGLAGYGWQEVTYKKGSDEKLEKTFGHLVAGGGFEYKVTKNVSLGLQGEHWFAEKKTFEDGGDKAVDERSDTRVLASVKYRFGDE